MTDKIINDYKETISRLQQECTEKTDSIIALSEQFKRKEEECELLNTQLESYHIGEPKLVAENAKLNKQLQAEKGNSKHLEDCLNQALKDFEEEQQRADKYKQALEDIKGIAENLIADTPEYHDCYYKDECGANCTPKKEKKINVCMYEQIDKILQKCEVLKDEH